MKINYSLLFIVIYLLNHTVGYCQRYDFNWMLGYAGGLGDPRFGITKMNFNNGFPILSFIHKSKMYIYDANASFSDPNGELLFYSNGYDIEDSDFNIMPNSSDLGIRYWEGLQSAQSLMFLPYPGWKDGTILIYPNLRRASTEFYVFDIRYLIINNKWNNGYGQVVERDQIILNDTINEGEMTACKHANGRDWWILINELNSNKYYKILVDPNGIHVFDTIFIGDAVISGLGQSKFSSNGNIYASYQNISESVGSFLYLYYFDRCSGSLDFITSKHMGTKGLGGIEFSPNSKFLYYCNGLQLFQFDLEESLLLDNQVMIDTITDRYLPWGSAYFLQQLAPDGRIYISSAFGSDIMHVINKPNLKGEASIPTFNSFKLKSINAGSIPNMPNYRLGPLDGSLCDTLGIDNIPWAHWRYNQDTLDYLTFEFTDLSAYEVEEWYWDFGDPNSPVGTSRDTNPIHTFSQNGVYEVCLIVKNKNGADTLCRTITIGTVSTKGSDKKILDIQVWPNPCKDFLIINVLDYNPQKMVLQINNSIGELVLSKKLYQGSNSIEVEDLHSGIYFISILEKGKEIKSEKLIKL